MTINDTWGLDSHKLHLHPKRVSRWLDGNSIAPIYVEVSPTGACNHRCIFCSHDFKGYRTDYLPASVLCRQAAQMAQSGVRAIMFAGDGEPFLHREMPAIARSTKEAGIDISFTTNGVMLTPKVAEVVLPLTSWIKISCNAGTAQNYTRIHRSRERDFNRVMRNLEAAARLRYTQSLACTLGMQMVLLPNNRHEAVTLARIARQTGMDYLVIKPYSQHPLSDIRHDGHVDVADMQELADSLAQESRPDFKVICRLETIRRIEEDAPYARCLALPFWMYIDAQGNSWTCSRHMGDARHCYGNILQTDFIKLLESPVLRQAQQWCEAHMCVDNCRAGCRMDAINRYLHQLRAPHPHVNFI